MERGGSKDEKTGMTDREKGKRDRWRVRWRDRVSDREHRPRSDMHVSSGSVSREERERKRENR
jgi:hypothetical protein